MHGGFRLGGRVGRRGVFGRAPGEALLKACQRAPGGRACLLLGLPFGSGPLQCASDTGWAQATTCKLPFAFHFSRRSHDGWSRTTVQMAVFRLLFFSFMLLMGWKGMAYLKIGRLVRKGPDGSIHHQAQTQLQREERCRAPCILTTLGRGMKIGRAHV